jgi:uncharacterized membrane protein SirB2
MQYYPLLKHIHVTSVVMSFAFFFVRWVWMLAGSPLLKAQLIKVLPHVIDTVLLASAIGLAILIRQYPGVNSC